MAYFCKKIKHMKNYYLLLFLASALLTSCVTSKIESNKMDGYNKQASRIYIKLTTSKESVDFLNEIRDELVTMFGDRKIEVQSGAVKELDLGEQAANLQDYIAQFQPDLILSLQLDAGKNNWSYQPVPMGGAYYNETNRLSAAMGTYPKDQPVWKAVVRSSSSLPGLGAHNIAKKLVKRLQSDGLIAPKPENATK